ncbi:MAG: chloride channel protein, partial [Bacteroidia bacterium]|nr:chloride channel protein [Bacteroidia bacterium]
KKKQSAATNLLKWLSICIVISILVGSLGASFVWSLEFVITLREQKPYFYWLLPIVGYVVGWAYFKWGSSIQTGNLLIFEEIQNPSQKIPVLMAPFIYIATVLTHLVGGSAGREGTAIQLGGALADQLSNSPYIQIKDRPRILLMGIAAGFSSVFGTPFTAFCFAFEVNRQSWRSADTGYVFLTAILANWFSHLWGSQHQSYSIECPNFSVSTLLWLTLSGICFALAAWLFLQTTSILQRFFQTIVPNLPVRSAIGGICLLLLFQISALQPYASLSLSGIRSAFDTLPNWYDWIAKLFLTAITLGSGWKGGEVTPLFYVGTTLGSWLSSWIPLPISFLAGAGLASVFSAASKTPIACIILSIELFGVGAGLLMGICCFVATNVFPDTNLYDKH